MKCMDILNIVPMKMKNEAWHSFIQNVVDQAIIIYDEHLFSKHEIPLVFREFIKTRLTNTVDDIPHGRVYYKSGKKEVWFRMESFIQLLRYKRVSTAKAAIYMWFKERGYRDSVTKDKNRKSIRHAAVTIDDYELEEIELAMKLKEEVI
jgi:hypothetical protein